MTAMSFAAHGVGRLASPLHHRRYFHYVGNENGRFGKRRDFKVKD
jgi:hypothetical protein